MRTITFAVVGCLSALGGCSRDVQWVLPDDYRGYFWIIVDKEREIVPPREDGRVVFIIPPSGVLRVADASVLTQWHKEKARYYSGKTLPSEPKPEEIAVRGLGAGSTNNGPAQFLYLVGTQAEFDRYYRKDQSRQPWPKGATNPATKPAH